MMYGSLTIVAVSYGFLVHLALIIWLVLNPHAVLFGGLADIPYILLSYLCRHIKVGNYFGSNLGSVCSCLDVFHYLIASFAMLLACHQYWLEFIIMHFCNHICMCRGQRACSFFCLYIIHTAQYMELKL